LLEREVAEDMGQRTADHSAIINRQCSVWTKSSLLPGVDRDYQAAIEWYRKSAEHGNATAAYNLAGMYYLGHGVPKDRAEALKWYRKAAALGDPDANRMIDLESREHAGPGGNCGG
jgi:hypothetical protein